MQNIHLCTVVKKLLIVIIHKFEYIVQQLPLVQQPKITDINLAMDNLSIIKHYTQHPFSHVVECRQALNI